MKIGLVAEQFVDGDIQYNFNQMAARIKSCSQTGINMLCFGESFLQGFEALSWQYEQDLQIACSHDDAIIMAIRDLAKRYSIAVSFGYIQKEAGWLYSSNMVISDRGTIVDNYKRVTVGWREPVAPAEFYREGDGLHVFTYRNKRLATATCGDLWDDENLKTMERITADAVLWPLYVDYAVPYWENGEEQEYAQRVRNIKCPVLMINSYVDIAGRAKGGCNVFYQGRVVKRLPMGNKGVLCCEI